MEQCISCKYFGNDIERDPCRGCTFGSGFGSNWEPAGEKSQWIQVTERLPEDDQPTSVKDPIRVIATIKYKGGYTTGEAIRMYTASGWVWWNDLGREVVAWNYYPEPFKPEETR